MDAAVEAVGADEDDDDVDYSDHPALVTPRRDGAQEPSAREEEVQRFNNTVSIAENRPPTTSLGGN